MKANIVTYLTKRGARKQVLVLRDNDTLSSGMTLDEYVASTDSNFGEVIGIETLHESTVISLK